MGAISQIAVWPFTTSAGGLYAFCCYFGFFSGGFVSLYPVVAADIYGVGRLASIAGALFSGFVPGTLAGPPIAGAIIDRYTDGSYIDFQPAAWYGGACMAASALMALVVKFVRADSIARMSGKERGTFARFVLDAITSKV